MGGALLEADAHNQRGYFEDVDFLTLNRRMLAAVVPDEGTGHADWGWTDTMDVSRAGPAALDAYASEADALLERRQQAIDVAGAHVVCWGWKDPRTSVLLDFWDARVPEARYVFIYRAPWDVADSMQRLGADVFLGSPGLAYRIWHHYNEALLAFIRRHRDRVVLLSADALLRSPRAGLDCIRRRFDLALDVDHLEGIADPVLLASAPTDVARVSASVFGECTALLRELDDRADLPSGAPLPAPLVAPTPTAESRISVVIPCYDDGAFLPEAVASVERSIRVPYDLTVVDDGSRDPQTTTVLLAFERAGYHVLRLPHRGLAHARNQGIAQAQSDIVLPLDADNRLRPGFVEAALDVLDSHPHVVAVYGDRHEFGLRSGRVEVGVPDLDRLLCGNYIDACAVLRRDAWRACGGYDETMPTQGHEDWDLWISMLERGFTLHRLDLETFDYRVRPGSVLTRSAEASIQQAIERHVLSKHAPFYLSHLRRQVDRLEAATDEVRAARRSPWAILRHRLSALRSGRR